MLIQSVNVVLEGDKIYMKKNRRILIVDDEPYNLMAIQIVLQQCGYQSIKKLVDTACSGEQAV